MEELIKRISEKVGITPEEAKKAVLITADYLKTSLPPSIYNNVGLVLDLNKISKEETQELGLFRIP
jgi:hypothetical protein